MDIQRAIEFVESHGCDYDRAKLNRILGRDFDATLVEEGFACLQNPDGGFPYGDRKGFPSCLSNTAMALQELIRMGLAGSEPARCGLSYLQSARTEAGIWSENPKIAPLDPPFWDIPEDEYTSIWLTADIADVLLRAGEPVLPETLGYLKDLQGSDGRFSGYYHTTWIALSLFGRNGRWDENVFSGALAYLEAADMGDWDVSCISWCLDCMNSGGVGRESPLRKKLLAILTETQEPDGGWPSDGGERMRVRDTNAVLAAVTHTIEK